MRLLVKLTQRSGRVLKLYLNGLVINRFVIPCSVFVAMLPESYFLPFGRLLVSLKLLSNTVAKIK
jgi:hypothetical protein